MHICVCVCVTTVCVCVCVPVCACAYVCARMCVHVCVSSRSVPPSLWPHDQGLFHTTAVTLGVDWLHVSHLLQEMSCPFLDTHHILFWIRFMSHSGHTAHPFLYMCHVPFWTCVPSFFKHVSSPFLDTSHLFPNKNVLCPFSGHVSCSFQNTRRIPFWNMCHFSCPDTGETSSLIWTGVSLTTGKTSKAIF